MTTSPAADTTEKPRLQSAFNLFKPSMEAIGRNIGTFVWLLILPFALIMVGMVPNLLTQSDSSVHTTGFVVGSLVELAGVVAVLLLGPALTYAELKSVRGEKVTVKEALRSGLHFMLRWIGISICLGVIFIVSFLLLVVPFFFMLRRYFLAPYYMIDRDLGVFAALKESAAESKRYSRGIWGMLGVEALISLVSAIPLLGWIGGTVLSILYFCAPAVRYLEITQSETAGKPGLQPTGPPANAKPAV
jgi:hypothetical protein